MENLVQEGKVMPFTAPSGGVTTGTPVLIGSLLVVPEASAAEGATFQGRAEGVFTLAKETSQAWTEGQKVYWDNGNSRCTTDAVDGMLVGVAAAAAGSADTTGDVRLNGVAPATSEGPQTAIADLTENSGAIGGTNDGDLPALVDPAGDAGASVIAGIRENAAKINAILAALRAHGTLAS